MKEIILCSRILVVVIALLGASGQPGRAAPPAEILESLLADHDQVVGDFRESYQRQGSPRVLVVINEDLFAAMAAMIPDTEQKSSASETLEKTRGKATGQSGLERKSPGSDPGRAGSDRERWESQPVLNVTIVNTQMPGSPQMQPGESAMRASTPENSRGNKPWVEPQVAPVSPPQVAAGDNRHSDTTSPAVTTPEPSVAELAWVKQVFQAPFLEAKVRFGYLPAVRLGQEQAATEKLAKKQREALLNAADLLLDLTVSRKVMLQPTLSDPAATRTRLVVAARAVDLHQSREIGAVNSDTLLRTRSFEERLLLKRLQKRLEDADMIEQAALRLMEMMTIKERSAKGGKP